MSSKPRIAVAGGGIGGTTFAIILQRAGYDCMVYEQMPAIARIGAGINLAPNSTRIFRQLGLEPRMRQTGIQARLKFSRDWDTGKVTYTVNVPELVERYGAPFFAFHRGELQEVLSAELKPGTLECGKRVIGLETRSSGVKLAFADGTSAEADAVVGADGVHSMVRELLMGAQEPIYYGLAAYRAIFPASLLSDLTLDDNTKWWGTDRYILTYFMSEKRDQFYWVTGTPEQWEHENFSPQPGSLDKVRSDFAGFHPDVQRAINAASTCTKWAIVEREPFRPWSKGPVVLLGDACHPTTPHLGQGAGMALEDAVVLARCIQSCNDDLRRAFERYENARFERCSRIQHDSHQNEWTRKSMDHSWVYSYDCFTVPLGDAELQHA